MSILAKRSAAASEASDAKRKAQAAAGDVKEGILEVANEAGHKVREVFSHYSDDLQHGREVLEENIRNKPLQSSFIALGLGVVLGLLIRR